jgi:uncharacterized protein YcfJ
MRTFIAIAGAGLMAASALAIPQAASADARGCRNTGTVVGGVAGALLGNGVSRGGGKTGGTIIGGLGGAVVGHEIAKRNCAESYSACRNRTYYSHGKRHRVHECRGSDGYWHRS